MKKQFSKINNLPHLKEHRRELRKNLTPAKAKLWNYLKNSQLDGRKFRRQHSVLDFVLDFYCPSEKLAVELGGYSAPDVTEQIQYRYEKVRVLTGYGIRLVSFESKMVFDNPDWVLEEIKKYFGHSNEIP